ncbi:hypothetical protein LAUMK4_00328 [Mycobacterium persicum]|uniref:Uncharacterized protein n=1 Tax=Mycobacterium persicum TaxID=1487726 RepID=A0ABY6RC32_9MYCO|nr:hypothetical protein [Mycobacterium persicum]VAZ71164.1 hypothetical protein LAUMK15_00681 [Mycobacterium persicum]VAZ87303.1 hypothetical protein LAUMK4_00328 [Mycobacterium persicum]
MITVGIGSVICGGRVGNAPGDGLAPVVPVVVGEVVVVVVVVVVLVVVVVVVGGEVVVVVVGAVVVVGGMVVVVTVVVTDAGVGRPCASWMMPYTITAMRAAISTPQPTNASGLRHPGMLGAG